MNKFYIQILIGASRTLNLYATLGYSNLQICSVFAEYYLFKNFIHIPYHIYMRFGISLTQFNISFKIISNLAPKVRSFQPLFRNQDQI